MDKRKDLEYWYMDAFDDYQKLKVKFYYEDEE